MGVPTQNRLTQALHIRRSTGTRSALQDLRIPLATPAPGKSGNPSAAVVAGRFGPPFGEFRPPPTAGHHPSGPPGGRERGRPRSAGAGAGAGAGRRGDYGEAAAVGPSVRRPPGGSRWAEGRRVGGPRVRRLVGGQAPPLSAHRPGRRRGARDPGTAPATATKGRGDGPDRTVRPGGADSAGSAGRGRQCGFGWAGPAGRVRTVRARQGGSESTGPRARARQDGRGRTAPGRGAVPCCGYQECQSVLPPSTSNRA